MVTFCTWMKNQEVLITFTTVRMTWEAVHSTDSVHLCGAVHLGAHRDPVEASYVPGTALAPAHHHGVEVQRARQALVLPVQEASRLLLCLPRVGSAARRWYREFPQVSLGIEISNTPQTGVYILDSRILTKHSPRSLSGPGHRLTWSLLLSPPQPGKTDSQGYLFVSKTSHMQHHCKEIYPDKTELHQFLIRRSSLISSDTPLDTVFLDTFLYFSNHGSVKALLELWESHRAICVFHYIFFNTLIRSIGLFGSDMPQLHTNRTDKKVLKTTTKCQIVTPI